MPSDGMLIDRPAEESTDANRNSRVNDAESSHRMRKLERLEHTLRAERASHRAIVQRYERLLGERRESRPEDRTRSSIDRAERSLTSRVIRWLQRL